MWCIPWRNKLAMPLLMFVTQAKHWLISRGREASRRSKTVILTAKKVGFWSPHPVRNAPTCASFAVLLRMMLN